MYDVKVCIMLVESEDVSSGDDNVGKCADDDDNRKSKSVPAVSLTKSRVVSNEKKRKPIIKAC